MLHKFRYQHMLTVKEMHCRPSTKGSRTNLCMKKIYFPAVETEIS